MDYGVYKNARNASWQCLIDCGVSELPVKPTRIASHYGVECIEFAPLLQDGEAGRILQRADGRIQIVLHPDQPAPRKRYTVLHELGHYLLGHLGTEPLARSHNDITQPEEYAAERFAADVLMPACVLWGLQLHTAKEIAQVCGVSLTAAQRRSERMTTLYQRNMFLAHPLERQVYRQFESFIRTNK